MKRLKFIFNKLLLGLIPACILKKILIQKVFLNLSFTIFKLRLP